MCVWGGGGVVMIKCYCYKLKVEEGRGFKASLKGDSGRSETGRL